MADYRKLIDFLLKWEGGFVNDPADSGGATNRGVTYQTYKALSKEVLGHSPSLERFKRLSKNEAIAIFHHFWNKATNNNSIHSQAVAEAITSWYWGSGNYGLKNFQIMLNKRFNKHLVIDGVIGPGTTGAINSIDEKKLFKAAIEEREIYFKRLAQRRPKDQRFLDGWLNRLSSFASRHTNLLVTGGSILGAFFLGITIYIISKKR